MHVKSALFYKAGYTFIAEYAEWEKWKVYSGVFRVTFFAFHAPFFAFRILHQGRHSREKSKDFVVYFLAALIKHKIRMKYEKYMVSVYLFFKIIFLESAYNCTPSNAPRHKQSSTFLKFSKIFNKFH